MIYIVHCLQFHVCSSTKGGETC